MPLARLAAPCAILALLTGCLGTAAPAGGDAPRPAAGGARGGSAGVVIQADQFAMRSSVLQVLQTRVSNMEIRRTQGCPEIQIRGRKSILLPSQPSVYVDGQHTMNTCVLESLSPEDISRVEVYPSGVSNRPGYFSNAGGLILVFLKTGQQ